MIYRLLYKLLHDAPEVRNVVGSRIYAEHAPAKTVGACIIIRVLSATVNTHLLNEADVAQPMAQIDCYDESARKAEILYRHVRNILSGYQPANVDVLADDGTETAIRVQAINLIRPGMIVEQPQDASDKWSYRWSADFEVFHSQAEPTHV